MLRSSAGSLVNGNGSDSSSSILKGQLTGRGTSAVEVDLVAVSSSPVSADEGPRIEQRGVEGVKVMLAVFSSS